MRCGTGVSPMGFGAVVAVLMLREAEVKRGGISRRRAGEAMLEDVCKIIKAGMCFWCGIK